MTRQHRKVRRWLATGFDVDDPEVIGTQIDVDDPEVIDTPIDSFPHDRQWFATSVHSPTKGGLSAIHLARHSWKLLGHHDTQFDVDYPKVIDTRFDADDPKVMDTRFGVDTPIDLFPQDHQLIVTTRGEVYCWTRNGIGSMFRSRSLGIVAATKTQTEGNLVAVADSQVVVLHDIKSGAQQTYRLRHKDEVPQIDPENRITS